MNKKSEAGAVLLCRDGVINRQVKGGEVHSWREFEFLPGALAGLRLLAEDGYRVLVVHAQQPPFLQSAHEFERLTQRMLLEVALAGGNIDRMYNGRGATYTELLRLAMATDGLLPEDTYAISDSAEKLREARGLGCAGILLQRVAFLDAPMGTHGGCQEIASNLEEAAERIVRRKNGTLAEQVKEKAAQARLAGNAAFFVQGI